MATIKFPNVNLKPVPTKNVIFEDWSAGMVTSVEGDNRDTKTSNLIRNLTNRYHGKLVMPHTKATYKSDANFFYCKKWRFVYANDTEYVLAWMNGKTANHDTLEISPTGTFSWTVLHQMSVFSDPDYENVDHLDWATSSSDGATVVYVTYVLEDGTGDTLKVSYKEQVDAMPYVDWVPTKDDNTNRVRFEKSLDELPPDNDDDVKYGTFLTVAPIEIDTYTQELSHTYASLGDGTVTKVAQMFEGWALDSVLESAIFTLRKVGVPTFDMTAEVWSDSAGSPLAKLATSDVVVASVLSDSEDMDIQFRFSGAERIDLTGEADYHVAVAGVGGSGNYVRVVEDSTSPTHAGHKSTYTGSWAQDTSVDVHFSVFANVHEWGTVDGVDYTLAEGDIVLLGRASTSSADYWVYGDWVDYVAVAEVVDVGTEYIELNRVPYPGVDLTSYNDKYLHVAKANLDWLDTEYTAGWHCRTIRQMKPWDRVFNKSAISGINKFEHTTTDLLGETLTSGIPGTDNVQYGYSYQYEGGQVTGLVTTNQIVSGEEETTYSHMKFKIAFDSITPIDDRLFRNWTDESESTADYVDGEVSAGMLWRRKSGEDEFGFLAMINRTNIRSIDKIEDIARGDTAFFLRGGDVNEMVNFVNILFQEHESATNEIYPVIGFTSFYCDTGDVLAETFRTVTGVEAEDAQNSVYGRCIASMGQRLFVGNVSFPHSNDKYEQKNLDDEIIYSVPDCGCMYPLDNTLGYRTGSSDAVVNIFILGSNLFIFKSYTCAIISIAGGSEVSWTPRGEFPQGLVAHDLVCNTPHGPVWFSRDGLYLFTKERPVNISRGIFDEYMAGVADPTDCAIAYEPRYDRLFVRLDGDPYWFGFDKAESGWKKGSDSRILFDVREDGVLIGKDLSALDEMEGSATVLQPSDLPAWESGQLTLGSCGEEIKLKRAYVWYSYNRYSNIGVTDMPTVELEWYIDGVLQDSEELDVSVEDVLTSRLQRISMNGRGRRVEFRIKFSSASLQNYILHFELKKVEIVYKTTRMK